MLVETVKTHAITNKDKDLFAILDRYIKSFKEKQILVITSKIIAICEGSVTPMDGTSRKELVRKYSDYYLDDDKTKYLLTIKDNILNVNAGIDESNGNGFYILWPKNPQKTANLVRSYLLKRFKLKYAGVVITDSRSAPMRSGTTGISIAYSGIKPLRNYIGKPDIFGRKLKVTRANIVDALAAAAVLCMGEGEETTPLAVVSGLNSLEFVKSDPSKAEIAGLVISRRVDIYKKLLNAVKWKKN